jgi:cysteine-rich repeat protein
MHTHFLLHSFTKPKNIAMCACDKGYLVNQSCFESTLGADSFYTNFSHNPSALDNLPPRCIRNDSFSCLEVNECQEGTHNCDVNAHCNNTAGSFVCTCKSGYRDSPGSKVTGVECPDIDECVEHTHDCFLHASCANTHGSFTCSCNMGFDGDGTTCTHTSEVMIEHVWPAGSKIGIFFSWRLKIPPHPRDLITIDVLPDEPQKEWFGKAEGRALQIFWMFTGAVGCSSQLTLGVGQSHDCFLQASCTSQFVIDCHRDTGISVPWSGMITQQRSPGYGKYTVRLFSYHLKEIAAVHTYDVTSVVIPGTTRIVNGTKQFIPGLKALDTYGMSGGLRGCVSGERAHDHDEVPLGPPIGTPELKHTCAAIEIPTSQGNVSTDEGEETVEVFRLPPRCGDGRLDLASDEECDDGNDANNDGCSSNCAININTICTYKVSNNVTYDEQTGLYNVYPPDTMCHRKQCGDFEINLPGETCDDGNLADFDGCSSECTVEQGFECEHQVIRKDPTAVPVVLIHIEKCVPFILWNHSGLCSIASDCHADGVCVLYSHVEYCLCKKGYSRDGMGGLAPVIIPGLLPPTSRLVDAQNNPMVSKSDMGHNPHHCDDVDECATADVMCPKLSHCVNTPGSFHCACDDGYIPVIAYDSGDASGILLRCSDMNECASEQFPCAKPGGTCVNTVGSYYCFCKVGFIGSGYVAQDGCADIDECSIPTHTCGETQICENTQGSFLCSCETEGLESFRRECYPAGFWQTSRALLEQFGYPNSAGSPSALHGLMLMWDVHDEAHVLGNPRSSASGVAQFFFNNHRHLQQNEHLMHSIHAARFDTRPYVRPHSAPDKTQTGLSLRYVFPEDCKGIAHVNITEGILSLDNIFYPNDLNLAWFFNDANGSVPTLHLHWQVFDLSDSETLFFCRQRRQRERDIFQGLLWHRNLPACTHILQHTDHVQTNT